MLNDTDKTFLTLRRNVINFSFEDRKQLIMIMIIIIIMLTMINLKRLQLFTTHLCNCYLHIWALSRNSIADPTETLCIYMGISSWNKISFCTNKTNFHLRNHRNHFPYHKALKILCISTFPDIEINILDMMVTSPSSSPSPPSLFQLKFFKINLLLFV